MALTRRGFCFGAAAGVASFAVGALADEGMDAPMVSGGQAFARLPAGRWLRLSVVSKADARTFRFQQHGGGAYDSRRHQLVIFGSDTHGRDWTNSPLFFDLETLRWRRAYENDSPKTYRVDETGAPVAGGDAVHPWAMHTMGAVEYVPSADTLVVASHPGHMEPGRFTDAMARVWPAIRRHPTWLYRLENGRWDALPGSPPSCFAYATVFDSDRELVIGLQKGVFELSLDTGEWRQVAAEPLLPWGLNAVYDSRRRAVVAFGSHKVENVVAVYETETGRARRMSTPGPRPPGGAYVPMAFHKGLGRAVALIQRYPNDEPNPRTPEHQRRMETWLYDLGRDAWEQVEGATLPFGWYMSYHLYYLPREAALILVTEPPKEPMSVFALRL